VNPVTPLDLDRLAPVQRVRLTLEVLRTYLQVRWVMRDDDAQRAVHRLRTGAGSTAGPVSEDELHLELVSAWRLARATRKVLERLPSDSRCLFRSLTLLCMLERRHIPQTLVIAVRPRPFGAHAWIEVAGHAILPDADPGYERLLEL
jgi:transglutaminase superfamily protein